MKRIGYIINAILMLCMTDIIGYATPEQTSTVNVGRVEIVDYILLIGIGIFLIGILFVLVSMYADSKKKNEEDIDEDTDEALDEALDKAEEDTEKGETEVEEPVSDDEPEGEDNAEAEEAVAEVESESETEVEDIKAEDETEEEVEPEAEAEEEVEPEAEDVEPEPEEEVRKVRIMLSGMNNSDVKVMEFSDKITLGRRGENDIIISDNAVSGKHCEIGIEDDKLYIQDLNSTNGTLVNDEAIERTELKSGDTLIVGQMIYKVNISM